MGLFGFGGDGFCARPGTGDLLRLWMNGLNSPPFSCGVFPESGAEEDTSWPFTKWLHDNWTANRTCSRGCSPVLTWPVWRRPENRGVFHLVKAPGETTNMSSSEELFS